MSDLGVARGRIEVSTEGIRRAQAEVATASRSMAQAMGQVGAALGISFGVAGLRQVAAYAVEIDAVATAYRRQSVAALGLAGSQGKLNDLLETYDRATGGVIDRAQALADVTRLQAIGFADSAAELDRFARAARGISVAMGASQDYVISQLTLAIANQSMMRLDQLGLDAGEAKERIDQLKASNTGLSESMIYQQAIMEQAERKFGQLAKSAEAQATGIERTAKAWKDLQLTIGQFSTGPIDALGQGLALFIDVQAARLRAWMAELDTYIRTLRSMGMAGPWMTSGERSWTGEMGGRTAQRRNRQGTGVVAPRFNDEQAAAIVEWSAGVRAIEKQANADRLDATRQYEEQRSSTIREYGKTIAREAEDFARSRARAEQDYAKSISDVREAAARREIRMAEDLARTVAQARADSAERLADMQEQFERTVATRRADSAERIAEWEADRNEAIADRRKESTERLIDLEEQFTRERERAMRDSRDRLFAAASRFDAYAIAQEQRRMAREQEERLLALREQAGTEREKLAEGVQQLEDAHRERLEDERRALDKSISQAQEAYNRQVADEREALAKRISQANEAHQRQLEDAREADAQRLEDMSESHAERLRREDEDRRTRLNRLAVDHNDQLNEMARQHGLRLTQITEQATEERQQLDEEFRKELDALGIRTSQWTAAQKQITDYAIAEFDRWWARIEEIANGLAVIGPSLAPIDPWSGPVFGGNNLSSGGSIGGGANISVAPGAIQVFAATGQNPMDIAGAVRTQMEELFRQLMGPYQQ